MSSLTATEKMNVDGNTASVGAVKADTSAKVGHHV